MPGHPEVEGLLALMLLTDARRPARLGTHGTVVSLPEQDRRRWDAGRIAEGTALVERALRRGGAGPYGLQAAIAALHAAAPAFEATDWPQIAALYGELLRRAPSPVVAVNRAVAVGFARGPEAGLQLLDGVAGERAVLDYGPLHAARAELLRRAGSASRPTPPTPARSPARPTPPSAPTSSAGARRWQA
jgi:RNA polymerase sigma-70 factor (ECF subfamily)